MKRYYIIFKGRIQGVGFRSFIQMQAINHHCTGWTKNLENGNVEVVLQGEDENINSILKEVKKGNMFIKVSDYALKQIPLEENETKFRIHYY